MKVEIKGYTPACREGVIACLKRNYPWMRKLSDAAVYEWAKPMLAYEWASPLPEKVKPYQHGMVLVAEGKVVGYLGFIFSVRSYKGKKYIYQTGTTWAIDDGYRIYMFKALKQAYALADVLGDFTPIRPVEKTLTKVFKFQYLDSSMYHFSFSPYAGSAHLQFHAVGGGEELEIPDERQAFQDHTAYGIHWFIVTEKSSKEKCCIAYRVIRRQHHRSFFNKRRSLARILHVSNPGLAARHVREIMWHLQKNGWPVVECDARFLNGIRISGMGVQEKRVRRLIKGQLDKDMPIDLLYSEEAVID